MDETSKGKLWVEYSNNKSSELKDQLIVEYAPLVKFVAGRLNMYLGHNVEYDDLISYGIFGLIDAIDKFDYEKGVKFETYASLRIRGAILDQIRKLDWIPRSLRQKQKKIDAAISKLDKELGTNYQDEDIAKELNITVEEYMNWQNQTKLLSLISLDEYIEQGSEGRAEPISNYKFDQPEKVIEKKELKKLLETALETLTEKEKKVIVLYYYEELTLKEISIILEVSESRISQLHTKALQKMKSKLGNYGDVLIEAL